MVQLGSQLEADISLGDGDVEVEEADEDNMDQIDPDNIVPGRTRGKNIDWAQAAKELGDDEDEDDDEDFVDPGEDKMEE